MNYTARMLSKIDRSQGPNACWAWTGRVNGGGYGQLKRKGKHLLVHRLMWEHANRCEIPVGMYVLHSCDNPRCCNPAHLHLGTPRDNMREAVDRGRINTKYTHQIVQSVLDAYSAGGRTFQSIADQFQIPLPTVYGWIRGTSRS